nr:YciI family protein [Phytoactinopolyspora halotolerans]
MPDVNRYLLSIYQPDGGSPPAEVLDSVIENVRAVNAEMREAGAWVFAAGLHPSSATAVVRPQDADVLVTDGPYIEGKEHVGGFTVIQAPDIDAALEWGRKLSRALTLPVEVRPVLDESERSCA